ncbi:MAG: sulfite exporter TauE/SafE family protein [Acidimicrobiaceae bacterium]|nr:sulfite exporter TauE/SafE family protein [Acidimicrobiaceae bacterium]MDB4205718.1 sulfite exporter TauE/SafE family protein [bacterium]MDC1388373.1 sulfite exporter TauE/SafE family protein [Acidimicrobiales bacterium]MDG1088921.1 sulfite exporter TauE/SafE family protein [Acidimicrobiales bacterium]HAY68648.1 sulfite exporter TauE/SafE family protein [Acidimicrobiaceae bacterium]
MDILATVGVLIAVYVSFTISASAGLGGSLLMVPTLALFLGTKEGVALAALLLASNNIMKIIAYRETLPFRKAAGIAVLIVIGAAIGSTLLVNAPVWAVTIAVLAMFATTIITEKREIKAVRSKFGPFLAFVAGASSGFSGTSGPLKGVAIRNLDLDRRHFVGAASLASFAGDAAKTAIFAEADLLGRDAWLTCLAAIPLMALGTWSGSKLNERLGEQTFAILFWTVMAGYSIRLGILLF